MKIVQINSVCGFGSTGRIAIDLYHAYEKAGHECVIAYGRGAAPQGIKTYRIGTEWGVKLHGALSRITDRQGFYSTRATKNLVEWLINYDPDILHLHNLHGYYLDIRVLFSYIRKYKKKVIWTLHDCFSFTGHCSHFDYCGCEKYITGCEKCPQKTNYPASYILDCSKKNYEEKKKLYGNGLDIHFVTPSAWLAGLVKKSFLSNYPVTVIPNGIDQTKFYPIKDKRLDMAAEKYQIDRSRKIILGVANVWNEGKGLKCFLQIWKHEKKDWQVVLVGLSKKKIDNIRKWQDTIKTENKENLVLIERTEDVRELAVLYSMADVFLNPSREETMGLTTIEAMACGTPVIVSDKTAVPEVVTEQSGVVLHNWKSVFREIEKIENVNYMPEEDAKRYWEDRQYQKYCGLILRSK